MVNCVIHGNGECVCLGARYWMDLAVARASNVAELQSRADAACGYLEDLRDKYNEESEHWAEFTGAIDLLLTGERKDENG